MQTRIHAMSAKRIFAATDLTPTSRRALDVSCDLALDLGAELVLFHCSPISESFHVGGVGTPRRSNASHVSAVVELDRIAAIFRQAGAGVRAEIAVGSIDEEVARAFYAIAPDFVVVGTRGRHGVARLVLGSVAEHVVRMSRAPVLVVHDWSFEDRADAVARLSAVAAASQEEWGLVVSSSQGAGALARALSGRLGSRVESLPIASLQAGSRFPPFGAVCPGWPPYLDPKQAELSGIADPIAFAHETSGRGAAEIDLVRLRRIVAGGPVLLAFDLLEGAPPALLGLEIMRRVGASRVGLAVPCCERALADQLRAAGFDGVLYVELTRLATIGERLYLDENAA